MIFTDEEGNKWEEAGPGEMVPYSGRGIPHLEEGWKLMKPVKKTEKQSYCLYFDLNLDNQDMQSGLVWKELNITETTADKLSEAISALVEYMQSPNNPSNEKLLKLAKDAYYAYQESQ